MRKLDWQLFKPSFQVFKLEETPMDWILGRFKVILIDVDNTLVKHNSDNLTVSKLRWINVVRKHSIKVALMTNNYNGTHIDLVADEIDADFVVHGRWPTFYKCYNPWIVADTLFCKPIRQTIQHFSIKPSELIVFNDSYIIACAANMEQVGASVLVEPICRKSEKSSTLIRVGRFLEKNFIIPELKKLKNKPGA